MLFSLQDSVEDWRYRTEPSDNYCLSVKEGKCRWPRGKVLGGCSSINAMLYVRGNKRDYDNWAKMGNPGWDYDSVLPYFKMSERLENENINDKGEYGKEGPLFLQVYEANIPIIQTIKKAAEKLGYPFSKTEKPLGYVNVPINVKEGERMNTAKAFLGIAKDRENLHLAINAHVTKILIDEATKTAKGVKVNIGGKQLTIHAKKEVVVSAGAINTPQLLMLSGIGPKKHLENVGIKTVVDLNVGENLQDHLIFTAFHVKINDSFVKHFSMQDKLNELYNYFNDRTGELARISMLNFNGFINTKRDSGYPNIQIDHQVNFKDDDYLIHEILRSGNYIDEFKASVYENNDKYIFILMTPILLNPKSRGKILLKSADANDPPLIYPNYLSDQRDLQTLLEAIRFLEQLVSTEPFQEASAEVLKLYIPNCEKHEFRSDEFWKCALRNIATTLYHPTGTAKMGPREDKTSVVGPDLTVHGVKNLRVADASIIPEIVSGNTNAPVIMIGQKVAALIKNKWQTKHDEL